MVTVGSACLDASGAVIGGTLAVEFEAASNADWEDKLPEPIDLVTFETVGSTDPEDEVSAFTEGIAAEADCEVAGITYLWAFIGRVSDRNRDGEMLVEVLSESTSVAAASAERVGTAADASRSLARRIRICISAVKTLSGAISCGRISCCSWRVWVLCSLAVDEIACEDVFCRSGRDRREATSVLRRRALRLRAPCSCVSETLPFRRMLLLAWFCASSTICSNQWFFFSRNIS